MAKTKQEKTPVMLAADKARDAYAKAKAANEKTDNAATKKAMEEAHTAMKSAVKAENRERFLTLGANRVSKAVKAIDALVRVANKKTYDYTEEDATELLGALTSAHGRVKAAFSTTSTNKGTGGFSFTSAAPKA